MMPTMTMTRTTTATATGSMCPLALPAAQRAEGKAKGRGGVGVQAVRAQCLTGDWDREHGKSALLPSLQPLPATLAFPSTICTHRWLWIPWLARHSPLRLSLGLLLVMDSLLCRAIGRCLQHR